MRLFSVTPKSSPELVRHSLVPESNNSRPDRDNEARSRQTNGDATPPRTHSPSLARGVSTLGRKFSRRFEKFGDSEAARRLRIASPSRKYHFGTNGNNLSTVLPTAPPPTSSTKKSVSRVDSFRNFFLSTSSTLKTPRAVKRRSRNTEKRGGRGLHPDEDGTASAGEELSHVRARSDPRDRFGSELTLIESDYGECQSEADLRYYTEDEDDRSVVSDSHGFRPLVPKKQFGQKEQHRSAGNLAAFRLGILPENRTINFREPGIVYADSNGLQIKSYGLIDGSKELNNNNNIGNGVRKKSNTSHESGYSSENNTSPNSSRASPRSSPEGETRGVNKLDPRSLTPSPPATSSGNSTPPPPSLFPKPMAVPPKKPARSKTSSVTLTKKPSSLSSLTDEEKMQMIFTKKSPKDQQPQPKVLPAQLKPVNPQRTSKSAKKSPMIDVAVAEDEDDDSSVSSVGNSDSSATTKKEYKIIRIAKDDNSCPELGIIIAKKRLRDVPTTGFLVVHIEPNGLIDR